MSEVIDYRKQFWVDFKNSQWVKDLQEEQDNLLMEVLTKMMKEDKVSKKEMLEELAILIRKESKVRQELDTVAGMIVELVDNIAQMNAEEKVLGLNENQGDWCTASDVKYGVPWKPKDKE